MAKAGITEYKEDEIILKQGDPDKSLYKILSGQVAVYINYGKEDEYLVGIQSFPSCFGEMTILSEQPSFYTVVALTETKILCVPEENFEGFIQSNPANAISIMKTMAKNISLLNMNIKMLNEEIAFNSTEGSVGIQEDKNVIEESPLAISGNQNYELYLPGHRGYESVRCPANEKFTYLKEYVCPHCGTKFVAPCINPASLDQDEDKKDYRDDMRADYGSFCVEWYQVVTCTHCYFSAFTDFFRKDGNYLQKEAYGANLKNAFSNVFLNFTAIRNMDFVFAQYYLALICVKGMRDETLMEARLWLNLSRLYTDMGEIDLSIEAAGKAASAYMNGFSILKPRVEHKICMSIAGIFYKNQCYKQAKELAFHLKTKKTEPSLYTRMAEDMIADIRKKGEK